MKTTLKHYGPVALLLAVILAASTCLSLLTGDRERGDRPRVLVTTYPLYVAAQNIVGDTDGVQLTMLSAVGAGCLLDVLQGSPGLYADILIDLAAGDDIHHLHAAADAQHRKVFFQCLPGKSCDGFGRHWAPSSKRSMASMSCCVGWARLRVQAAAIPPHTRHFLGW